MSRLIHWQVLIISVLNPMLLSSSQLQMYIVMDMFHFSLAVRLGMSHDDSFDPNLPYHGLVGSSPWKFWAPRALNSIFYLCIIEDWYHCRKLFHLILLSIMRWYRIIWSCPLPSTISEVSMLACRSYPVLRSHSGMSCQDMWLSLTEAFDTRSHSGLA